MVVGLLLCACASSPEAPLDIAALDCTQREPVTGSMVVRREQCITVSEEARQEARRQTERMIQEQDRIRRNNAAKGN